MRQKTTQSLTVQNKQVPFIQRGSGSIPCVIFGPGSIYMLSLSTDLDNVFTFYDADYYFTTAKDNKNKASVDDVQKLTLDQYVDYYDEVRQALGLEKMAIMTFSATDILGFAYMQKYPERVSHTIMVSGVITTKDLAKRQQLFMEANFGPARPASDSDTPDSDDKKIQKKSIDLTTTWSKERWERDQKALQDFKKMQNLPPEESLVEEVYANQARYTEGEPEDKKVIKTRWDTFSPPMRNHFFASEQMTVGFDLPKGFVCKNPTLFVGGGRDGIAPFTKILDAIQKGDIGGNAYSVIFIDKAHSPQTDPNFPLAVETWVDHVAKHPGVPKNQQERDAWLDPIQSALSGEPTRVKL